MQHGPSTELGDTSSTSRLTTTVYNTIDYARALPNRASLHSDRAWDYAFPATPLTASDLSTINQFISDNLAANHIDKIQKTSSDPFGLLALAIFNAAQGALPLPLALINIKGITSLPLWASATILLASWGTLTRISAWGDWYKIDRRLSSEFKLQYASHADQMTNKELAAGTFYIDLANSNFREDNSELAYYTHDSSREGSSHPEINYLRNLNADTLLKIAFGKLNELSTKDCADIKRAARHNGHNPEREPDQLIVYGKRLDSKLFFLCLASMGTPAFFGGFVLGLTIAATDPEASSAKKFSLAVTVALMNMLKSAPVEIMLAINSVMEASNEKEKKRLVDEAKKIISEAETLIKNINALAFLSNHQDNPTIQANIQAEITAANARIATGNAALEKMETDTDHRLAPITQQPYFWILFNDTFLAIFSDWFPVILSMTTMIGLSEAFQTTGASSTLALALCLLVFPVATSATHTFVTYPLSKVLENLNDIYFSIEHSLSTNDNPVYRGVETYATRYLPPASLPYVLGATTTASWLLSEFATGQYLAIKLPLKCDANKKAIGYTQVTTLAIVSAALVALAIITQIFCAEKNCYEKGNGTAASYASSSSTMDASYEQNTALFDGILSVMMGILLFATGMTALSALQNILSRIDDIDSNIHPQQKATEINPDIEADHKGNTGREKPAGDVDTQITTAGRFAGPGDRAAPASSHPQVK
jgi:hypothetical protein